MALEQYKTQILLLHSEQSTLDSLSTGFNDRYSVHLATSGIEALNIFTETPVHVIVSAQDLPGMSGLDALREAKKRSPDTIGILLAGTDQDDGLEALVGDKEVFQIVRGDVTPESLKALIDSATQRARILALSESANDSAADVDQPTTEHIIMETSENGSTIISDGTGQMPALQPNKISVAPDTGSRNVDILVLTKDDEFLATIKDSARGMHNVHHSVTPTQAEEIVKANKVGVLVTDAAMVGSNIEVLTQRLRQNVPRLVAVVAGRRDDGELLMDLINRGQVYRFLLKPVSPGRARLAIEASIKHHLEAADKSFKSTSKKTQRAAPQPKPKPKPRPAAKPAPTTQTRTRVSQAAPITVSRNDSLLDNSLEEAFDEGNSFTETMTGIVSSVGKKISEVAETISTRSEPMPAKSKPKAEPKLESRPTPKPQPTPKPVPAPAAAAPDAPLPEFNTSPSMDSLMGSSDGFMQNPKFLSIGAAAVIVIASFAWFALGTSDSPPETTTVESSMPPVEIDTAPAPPVQAADPVELLASARRARDAGQLILPPGENAVELYVAAAQAAPSDFAIAEELDAVVEQVFAVAESAILAEELTDAATAIQLLHFASPNNPRLPFVSAQLTQLQLRQSLDDARIAIANIRFEDADVAIANARILSGSDTPEIAAVEAELDTARAGQEISEVLAMAAARLRQNQLISPPNDNARYFYQLALVSDPGNTTAQEGLSRVADDLVVKANVAIDDGQFTNAEDLLRNARALDATSSGLAASTAALASARSVSLQAAADAQAVNNSARLAEQERIADEQRQADADRQAEEQRIADQESIAEEQRIAQEQRQAEERRQAAAAAAIAASATVATADNNDAGNNSNTASKPASETSYAAPAQDSARTGDGVAEGAAATFAMNTSADTVQPAPNSLAPEPAGNNTETTNASGSNTIEMVPVSSLTRINYVSPKYPRSAQRRNVTGTVDVSFTVLANGIVSDISVLDSTPGTVFDQAAMDAIAKWRFEPTVENGVQVEKRTAVRLAFNLQ